MLADLFICWRQRTFRTSASMLSGAINIVYMVFLHFTSKADGCYPYAFLESMPAPYGIAVTALVLVAGVEGLFLLARRLKRTML